MSAQFYLSLLNPILALAFSILTALLWRKWPSHGHFFPLSVAFLYLGLAFISQEWPLFNNPGGINYAGNVLFYAAVLLACISALVRVGARMPALGFTAITVGSALGFCFFAWIAPSTLSRIFVVNGSFALITVLTLIRLAEVGVRDLSDRLFMGTVAMGTLLSLARPTLILTGTLALNAEGGVDQSSYWGSVAGLTPLLAIAIAGTFVFSMVLDIITRLRRDAEHDLLTGLLNRRGFEAAAAGALAGGAAGAALLVADIDDFKSVNDQFGHAVGDRVIATVGDVLARRGQADFAGRVGGEEFALFYRQAETSGLNILARAIAEGLEDQAVEGLPRGYRLTLSIGLHARQAGETLDDMQILADRALYRAKAEGKNRAVASPARLKLA